MLIKSRRTIAVSVSVLAIAAAGGSVAVVGVLNQSPAPTLVAPASQPSAAGPAATASVPRGAGNADGQGSASTATGNGNGAGAAGSGQAPALSRSAGQGDQGPLATGSVPADGAVPGAGASIQAMAAARATTAALPHSPQLLADLKAASGSAPASGAATARAAVAGAPATAGAEAALATASAPASPSGTGSPAASPSSPGTATSSGTATPAASPTAQASGSQASGSQASGASPAAAAAPLTAAHTVAGIDVANYQHPVTKAYPSGQPVSWASVARAGYRYAAVKATEGDYYVNPWAAKDLAGAKAAGLDVTPYHFAVPNVSSGTEQARFAVEYSGYASGARMLPLMLDIEYDPYVSTDHTNSCYGLGKAQMTTWLSAFVAEARTLTGQYPVIYTTANWWDTCTGSAAFGNDPMWVAAYGFTSPPMPAGWHAYTFWQYTSSGTVPGVNSAGTTDIDHFNPGAVGLINPGAQTARAGAAVSLPVASLGALAGETLTFSAGGLPPGVTLRAGGTLAGTVAAAAARTVAVTYKVTVTAKNASGAAGTVTFSWKLTPSPA